jgi:predicted nucleic acid-binding protein
VTSTTHHSRDLDGGLPGVLHVVFHVVYAAKFTEKPSSIFQRSRMGKDPWMTAARPTVPKVVLDTNVLLDWLVFQEPGAAPVAAAVMAGSVSWIACAAMRAEFERTLGYTQLARWRPDAGRALACFDRYATLQPHPATLAALRCSDLADQVFMDLAVAHGCEWLISHDRALHRLARRASRLGVKVIRPRDWPPNTDRAAGNVLLRP